MKKLDSKGQGCGSRRKEILIGKLSEDNLEIGIKKEMSCGLYSHFCTTQQDPGTRLF